MIYFGTKADIAKQYNTTDAFGDLYGAKKERGDYGHQFRVFIKIDAKAIARGDWDFDETVTENGHGWYGDFVGHSSGADDESVFTSAMYADDERRAMMADLKREFGF